MNKFLNWLLLVTMPLAFLAVWFVEDIQTLRMIAFLWGLNVWTDAIGCVAGYTVEKSR